MRSLIPTVILAVVTATIGAASDGEPQVPQLLVFPGANSRATAFTLHRIAEAREASRPRNGHGTRVAARHIPSCPRMGEC